jgi:hypothetical protein
VTAALQNARGAGCGSGKDGTQRTESYRLSSGSSGAMGTKLVGQSPILRDDDPCWCYSFKTPRQATSP